MKKETEGKQKAVNYMFNNLFDYCQKYKLQIPDLTGTPVEEGQPTKTGHDGMEVLKEAVKDGSFKGLDHPQEKKEGAYLGLGITARKNPSLTISLIFSIISS